MKISITNWETVWQFWCSNSNYEEKRNVFVNHGWCGDANIEDIQSFLRKVNPIKLGNIYYDLKN